MNLDDITPLILTFNEAPNIQRTLERLTWARRIVVIDSFSTDETLSLMGHYPQVEVVQRRFDSFANQCNFGLTHIRSQWVLSLDADYQLSDGFVEELIQIDAGGRIAGFKAAFTTCVLGRPLRGGLYPPRTVLYQRSKAVYQTDGHAHRVQIDGHVATLKVPIFHDDRKSLSVWLQAQDRYAIQEAAKLARTPFRELSFSDKLRWLIVPAPIAIVLYTFVVRRMALQGFAGWFYVLQRALAEILLSLRLIENRLQPPLSTASPVSGEPPR